MADDSKVKHNDSRIKEEQEIDRTISIDQGETESATAKHSDSNTLDEAATYLAGERPYAPLTAARERQLRKKIDSWMIPLVRQSFPYLGSSHIELTTNGFRNQLLFTATLGAVDKVELSTAALYGFKTDNHLVGQQYSWLGSIISVGVCHVPLESSAFDHRLTWQFIIATVRLYPEHMAGS